MIAESGFGPGYGQLATAVVVVVLIISAIVGEVLGRRDVSAKVARRDRGRPE